VCVLDVAAAISACVQKPETIGKTFDVVGPAPMKLRNIVRTVAEAMGRPVVILPTPYHLMKPAVHVMGWVMREPLSTPAQLQMLREGMTGDVEPMRRELGVEPREFTAENIRGLLPG
jgi:NADH dehydrogenase